MHSDFWTLCEILQAAEIGITVLSTGILLKRDAERLVHYCDDVIVSLDGPREVRTCCGYTTMGRMMARRTSSPNS